MYWTTDLQSTVALHLIRSANERKDPLALLYVQIWKAFDRASIARSQLVYTYIVRSAYCYLTSGMCVWSKLTCAGKAPDLNVEHVNMAMNGEFHVGGALLLKYGYSQVLWSSSLKLPEQLNSWTVQGLKLSQVRLRDKLWPRGVKSRRKIKINGNNCNLY